MRNASEIVGIFCVGGFVSIYDSRPISGELIEQLTNQSASFPLANTADTNSLDEHFRVFYFRVFSSPSSFLLFKIIQDGY